MTGLQRICSTHVPSFACLMQFRVSAGNPPWLLSPILKLAAFYYDPFLIWAVILFCICGELQGSCNHFVGSYLDLWKLCHSFTCHTWNRQHLWTFPAKLLAVWTLPVPWPEGARMEEIYWHLKVRMCLWSILSFSSQEVHWPTARKTEMQFKYVLFSGFLLSVPPPHLLMGRHPQGLLDYSRGSL